MIAMNGYKLPGDAAVAIAALVAAGLMPPGEYRAATPPVPFWKRPARRDGRPRRVELPRLALPCKHLGDPVGDRACAGRQPRDCARHGRVTVLPCANADRSCEGGRGREPCPDYEARGGDAGPSLASAARTSASE